MKYILKDDRVSISESFIHYRTTAKEEGIKYVNLVIYMRIITGFIKFMVTKLLDGFEVRLSGGKSLGTISIRGSKLVPKILPDGTIKGVSIDRHATNKLWKSDPQAKLENRKIYHLNDHTNGIRYYLYWSREGMKIANKFLYTLCLSTGKKGVRRGIAMQIKDNNKEYIVTQTRNYVKQNSNFSEQGDIEEQTKIGDW